VRCGCMLAARGHVFSRRLECKTMSEPRFEKLDLFCVQDIFFSKSHCRYALTWFCPVFSSPFETQSGTLHRSERARSTLAIQALPRVGESKAECLEDHDGVLDQPNWVRVGHLLGIRVRGNMAEMRHR